jgi:hypothetical protein
MKPAGVSTDYIGSSPVGSRGDFRAHQRASQLSNMEPRILISPCYQDDRREAPMSRHELVCLFIMPQGHSVPGDVCNRVTIGNGVPAAQQNCSRFSNYAFPFTPFIPSAAMAKMNLIDEHTTKCASPRQDPTAHAVRHRRARSHPLDHYKEKKMNAKNLIAAVAVFAAAGSAFADQPYPYVDFGGFQGTRTRAEVAAELQQAQSAGNYVVGGEETTSPVADFAAVKSRVQVVAELRRAQEDGAYVVGGEEYDGQFPTAQPGQTRLAAR